MARREDCHNHRFILPELLEQQQAMRFDYLATNTNFDDLPLEVTGGGPQIQVVRFSEMARISDKNRATTAASG